MQDLGKLQGKEEDKKRKHLGTQAKRGLCGNNKEMNKNHYAQMMMIMELIVVEGIINEACIIKLWCVGWR